MIEVTNSSFLDFTSYGTLSTSITDPATAYQLVSYGPVTDVSTTITVALVLERATSPADLLAQDWGTRQQTLAQMQNDGTLWTTYGTASDTFSAVETALTGLGIPIVGNDAAQDGYVTSAASRTIWVELDADAFQTLFGTPLMVGYSSTEGEVLYWNGNLSLPDSIAASVVGLWPDASIDSATSSLSHASVELPENWQSIGNTAPSDAQTNLFPQDIAALYNFPLTGSSLATGTIGLIEPGVGDAVSDIAEYGTFRDRLTQYQSVAGVTGTGDYYVLNRDNQSTGGGDGERSLDVGVVSTVVPQSTIGLYVGSGISVFTAYQTAIWDTTRAPEVISSSWSDGMMFAPGSPFATAYRELFVDAALLGVSMFNDAFDGGSGNETETGLTNLFVGSMSPYAMVVGGTSLSTLGSAETDPSLQSTVTAALNGDLTTIWQLVRGGLKTWSASLTDQSVFIEAVWNQYFLDGQTLTYNYFSNSATSGGVDTTQPTPEYQIAFGLTPTDADPGGATGRGAPDVSAIAGGNMNYTVPDANMLSTPDKISQSGGTSAATPLWASFATQINTIFADQNLPSLGYANDLYYIAAAISPASFNDVVWGNNTSTFVTGNSYFAENDHVYYGINATGIGYEAGPGYDLTTGLGTPNGVLLARALSTIAHAQIYYDLSPVLSEGVGGWSTTGTESLLFQTSLAAASAWTLTLGSETYDFAGTATGAYAWTAALAQQSLQADFSSDLVTMFDGYAQGQVYQTSVAAGTGVSLTVGGAFASAYQSSLTADYGFINFLTDAGALVDVARPVAVATTAGGMDDADVIVRLRQNGMNDISVMLYQVDDFSGSIAGLSPGDAGYAAAAANRAYHTSTGETAIAGGGYGAYEAATLQGVGSGDLIAMTITSAGETYWAFASANEQVDGQGVAHIWSYGLNTWGWEDLYGGGDRDYNDLIVQLDFTSASGSGLLL